MEPMTAQMTDATVWFIAIVVLLFVARFLDDVYFSEDWENDRATKRFHRKLARDRKRRNKLDSEI